MSKVRNVEFEEKDKVETKYKEEPIKEEKVIYKPKKDKDDTIVTIIITVVVCVIAFALIYYLFLNGNKVVETTKLEKNVTVTDTGIADAVEKVYDSVVVIETYQNSKAYASGTGFVFKTDDKYGYILTNHHVVYGANGYKVTLTNSKTVDATLVGSDEYSDIAVLTIDKSDVILVSEIGSSSDMRVGDTTFAVGAPIDSSVYSWTVTRGILSGKNRLVEVSSSTNSNNTIIMEVLQTDTAINSGNSGGPLCNANGEVIGITNMKLSSSTIEGMGFAIPIDDAIDYATSIISGKGIARPYLGVSLTDGQTSYNNNSWYGFFGWGNTTTTTTGVYVQTVEDNSAADKAGIKAGDKIVKVGDTEVEDVSHFKYELYKYNIGDKVKITIERNGEEKTVTATLASNVTMN